VIFGDAAANRVRGAAVACAGLPLPGPIRA
jgi:hypothetical protein